MVNASVMIPLLSLRFEVDAGSSGEHVVNSVIWLLGEVFLLWCLGVILVVWVWVMRRRMRGWYNLYFLMVLVCVVGWMLDVVVVVWFLVVVVVCVGDDPLVVGWLGSEHFVLGCFSLRTFPRWMRAVFTVKQAIESSRLLGPFSASSSCAVAVALRGVFLTTGGLSGWVLIGYGVHLLLVAIVPAGEPTRHQEYPPQGRGNDARGRGMRTDPAVVTFLLLVSRRRLCASNKGLSRNKGHQG